MVFSNQILQGIKKETEDKPEDKFQVYDLRDSDLEKIDLHEFRNSIIFFSNGDFVDELKQFEEALERQDGIFNMKPRKYFNLLVVTNNPCSPMVIREENSLEQLKTPCPIILDVHGKLGTQYQGSTSTFIVGIGIEAEQLFEFEVKNDENIASNMDVVAKMIKYCLEWIIDFVSVELNIVIKVDRSVFFKFWILSTLI